MEEKTAALVQQLYDLTKLEKLNWTTENAGWYNVRLPSGSIVLGGVGPTLMVFNTEGGAVTYYEPKTPGDQIDLRELYDLVDRTYKRVDQTLDGLLTDLSDLRDRQR